MADDKGSPSGPPGGKRRRPPTTIDLKATEIASDSVNPSEPTDSAKETPPSEAPAAASKAGESPPEAAPAPPPGPGWRPEWLASAAMNDRLSALRARVAEQNWRVAGAGAAGAAAVFVIFLALWAFGSFGARDDWTAPLAARLATLESQVRDLAARPQPPAVDPRALADLTARVAAAEQAAAAPRPAQPDPALTGRVTALEAAVRPLAELGSRVDAASAAARDAKARADAAFEAAQKNSAVAPAQAADHKELEALVARVTALEEAAKATEEKIARAAASAGADRAGRLAFVAVALRSAVERGEPFAQELAAVKPLVPDAAATAPLEPFAATGVPRTAALARELSQLAGPMLNAAGTAPRDGGIMDRLAQNAERLVRIRPINEAPGDEPATVVARADAKATHGDLSGALAELGSLPAPVRAPAQGWMKRAEAQVAALAAARALADNAVAALAKAAP
ncbi:MAG: hypothetical protein QOF14_3669 [Hyphomicrobiales bacterium]|jgi:hypothetical protein|nr:hypothetical protein [Hyphomicrobiales bacterium]